MNIATLTIEMAANIARLTQDMQAARGVVERNAQAMQKAADLAGKALGALGVGLSLAAFTGFIRGAIDAADAAGKLSARTGIATKDLAGLQLAYEQAGLGQDVLANSTAKLSKQMADGGKALEAMGIKSRGANGDLRATKDVIYEVAEKFASYADGAGKAALAQELFGKSGSEMIPLLNGGAEAMMAAQEAAEKLGLTISDETAAKAGEFNDTLDLLQRGLGGVATRVAAELLPTLSNLAGEFLESATSGDTLKNVAHGLANVLKTLYSVGAVLTQVFASVGKTLGLIGAQLMSIMRGDIQGAVEMGRQWSGDMKTDWAGTAKTISNAWSESGNATVDSMVKTGAAAKAQAPTISALTKAHADAGAAAKKAAAEALKMIEAGVKLTNSLLAVESGLSGDFEEKWDRLAVAYKAGETSLTQLTQAQAVLLKQQPKMKEEAEKEKKALEEEAQAWTDVWRAMVAYGHAQEQAAQSVVDGNKGLREEIELIGLSSKQQTEVLRQRSQAIILTKKATLAELERQAAITGTMTREQIALAAEIDALEERNELLTAKEARESWTGFWESVNSTAHDTFVNVAEEGMGAFKRIGKTLKSAVLDMLYQMTIKKWIVSISGSLTGALAGGVAQAATGGGGGGIGGIASGASALAGIGGSLAAGAGWITGATTLSGSLAAGASLIGTGTMAGAGAGFGMIAGALGPIALGIGALVSIAKMTKGEERTGGQFGVAFDGSVTNQRRGQTYTVAGQQYDRDFTGGLKTALKDGLTYRLEGDPVAQESAIKQAVSGTASSINELFKALGSSATLAGFSAGLETSGKGRGGVFAGGVLADGTTFGESGKGDNYKGTLYEKFSSNSPDFKEALENFTLDLKQSTVQALQSVSDIPQTIQDMLAGVDAEALAGDAADALLTAINAQIVGVGQLKQAFETMGLDKLAAIGFDAAAGLAEAAGGFDALMGGLTSYYANFYTEAERMDNAAAELAKAFASAGVEMPATKDAYRTLVEEQLAAGESGAELAAKLLLLNGTFAEVTDYAEQAAKDAITSLLDAVGIGAADMGKTFRDVLLGRTDAAEAGAALADSVTGGIYNAIAGGAAQQLTDLMMTSLITPVVQAAVAGTSISEAVSQSAIDSMVQQAQRAAAALGQIFSDPAFQAAIASVGAAITGVVSAAGAGIKPYSPAVVAAASSAGDSYARDTAEPLKNAWEDLIATIVRSTQDAVRELSRLGMTSYEAALASIQDKAQEQVRSLQDAGYMRTERERLEQIRSQIAGAADLLEQWRRQGSPDDAPYMEELKQKLASLTSEFGSLSEALSKLPAEVQAMVDAERALLEARNQQSADKTVADLSKEIAQLDMTDLQKQLAGIADKANEYRDSLKDLGQGTDANIAAVNTWADAMTDAANTANAAARQQSFTDAYSSQLGRAPDTAGLEYWIGVVQSGTMTMEQAMAAFSEGATKEGLNNRILELTDAEGYLAQMRANELSLLSPANQLLQERIWALEEEARIAQERTGLQDQLNSLTDTAAQALTRQRDALDASNRALFDQIQAATLAKEIEQERAGLQDQLNQLTLTSVDLRALEIAKLDEANRPLQERIWLLEEEKRVAEERNGLMSSLYQVLGNTGALRAEQLAKLDPANQALQQQIWHIEDAKTALEKALQAESESANAAQQAAQERVSTLQSIFDALKSNVDSLYESVEATKEWGAAQANAFIDNALANAKATGYMPELDGLNDAMAGARGGLDKQYATEFERQRETLVLAGKLSELQDISGGQLTAAERQLKAAEAQVDALDGLQKQGRDMLESLSGNVAATLSVRDAIAQLSAAVLATQAAQAVATGGGGATGGGEGVGGYKSDVQRDYEASIGLDPSLYNVAGELGKYTFQDGILYSPEGTAQSIGSLSNSDSLAAFQQMYGAGNVVNLGSASEGFTPAYQDYLQSIQDELKSLPGFATGINVVPHDMTARIHEGEAVVPAKFNPFNPRASQNGIGGNTARLEALVEGLTKKLEGVQAELKGIRTSTASMAENIDEVTEGGNAIRSRSVGATA